MPGRELPTNVCNDCYTELKDHVDADAIGTDFGVENPPEHDPCDLCEQPLHGDTYYEIKAVRCSEELRKYIEGEIYACDEDHCGRIWDREDNEWVLDETNSDVLSVFSEALSQLDGKTPYGRLLRWLSWEGTLEKVEFPNIHCRECSANLQGWYQEVKTEMYFRIIPNIPSLPPREISTIPEAAARPEEVIEYFRADCSNVLIHLTKGGEVEYAVSNVDEGDRKKRQFSAQEILYLIMATKRLKAFRGKGLHAAAVCFTEKPLVALKDTLLGNEAQVRRTKQSILWEPYGLMPLVPPQ